MDDFNSYEFKVEQKHEGKWLLFRILLIFAYVLYTVGYLVLIISTRIIPLGALIPLTLWILIFFTWRYANPDYEYTIAAGVMSFYVRYGNKKKKLKTQIRLSDAESITPMSQFGKDDKKITKVYNALPSKKCEDAYAVIYKDSLGKRSVLYFMATAQALKLIRFYNKNVVIQNTKY